MRRAVPGYLLRQSTREQSIAQLRGLLAHVRSTDDREPPRPRCHLLAAERLRVYELVEGAEVGVTFERDGEACTLIGRVTSIRRRQSS